MTDTEASIGASDGEADDHTFDPIRSLLSTSENVMCPKMSESIVRQLQEGDDPAPCLMQLARFFRDQSKLLLKQAKLLDELALGQEIDDKRSMGLMAVIHQKNVEFWVQRSRGMLEAAHDRLDAMEDSLKSCKKEDIKKVQRKVTSYEAFVRYNYRAVVSELDSKQGQMKELAQRFKALSPEERREYDDKAAILNKNAEKEREEQPRKKVKVQKRNVQDEDDAP